MLIFYINGEVSKRPTGADCKSVGETLRAFESRPHHCLIAYAITSLVTHRRPLTLVLLQEDFNLI